MIPVPDLTGAGFGNIAHLPSMDQIPKEFQNHNNKWVHLVSTWFFMGLPKGTEFIPKEGVDTNAALRAIKVVIASFAPSHEHKEAGAAYLLSEWFQDVVIPPK